VPRSDIAWVLAIVALAAGLRFTGLGDEGLWADEAATAWFARRPPLELVASLGAFAAADFHPPFFYFLESVVTHLLGASEWTLRFLPAIFGLCTVPAVCLAGKRLLGPREGLLAGFLLATSPLHIHYSQEARSYTLLMLLVLAAFASGFALVRAPTTRRTLGFAAVTLALLYCHNLALFFLAGIGAALAPLAARSRSASRALALALLLVLAGYLPWLRTLAAQESRSTIFHWVQDSWAVEFPWQIPRSLAALTHGSIAPIRNRVDTVTPGAWTGLGLALLLAVGGIRARHRLREPLAPVALLVATVVPLVLVFLYSWTRTPIYVVGRTDCGALACFLLAAASGLAAVPPRLAWLVPVAFAGLALQPLDLHYRVDFRSQERNIARFIAGERQPPEVVVTTRYLEALTHYLGLDPAGPELVSFPLALAASPAGFDDAQVGAAEQAADAATIGERVLASRQRGARRFLVLLDPGDREGQALGSALDLRFKLRRSFDLRYQRAELREYDLPADAGATPGAPDPVAPPAGDPLR
jgi:uncharacterized membrane protein